MSDSLATVLWYGVRVAGVSAYLVLWLTTAAGVCVTGRIQSRWLPTSAILFVHQLGDLALSLAARHAILLLGDRFAGFTPTTLVVPFRASYRPLWTGLGILTLYLLAVVQWSIKLRPRLGYRAWRAIHYTSFAVFALALVHGLLTGTDSIAPPLHLMYFVTGASVAALVVWRWKARTAPVAAPRASL
ncbi:MAG: ferric reductase-like transmembrane domain-containing protein [Chloroflexota bacterium]